MERERERGYHLEKTKPVPSTQLMTSRDYANPSVPIIILYMFKSVNCNCLNLLIVIV